jgi:hypothetical protein
MCQRLSKRIENPVTDEIYLAISRYIITISLPDGGTLPGQSDK